MNLKITLFLTAAASTAHGFAPVSPARRVQRGQTSTPPLTSLSMSDNTGDDFKTQLKELEQKANEKLPSSLYVDMNRVEDELANKWGYITGTGIASMVLGAFALYLPSLSTGVAYDATVLTIGASGFINLFAAFARENGHKFKSALSGAGYLALSAYMSTHPAQGLNAITFAMAAVIASEGLFETALAIKNKNLQGRGFHFVSGIASTLAAMWLTLTIPASSLFAPGVALGTRLTTNGATKVAVGLTGKKIADERKRK